NPLAVIRISSSEAMDPMRTVRVQGMVGEQAVSRGEGTVQIVPGSWQKVTVALVAGEAPAADAGSPDQTDGGVVDADEPPVVDGPASPDAAVDAAPADVAPVDGPVDLPPPVDLPADLPGPDRAADTVPDGPPITA